MTNPAFIPQQGVPAGWQPPSQQPQAPQTQAWNPAMSPVQQGATQQLPSDNAVFMSPPHFAPPAPVAPTGWVPAWQGGAPQFAPQQPQQQVQYPQQQQQYPQQQQQQQQAPRQQQTPAAQAVQFDQQGRMFGAGVPAELQGLTMPQALSAYGMMRTAFSNSQRQAPQAQVQAPQMQPPNNNLPSRDQIPASGAAKTIWSDPDAFLDRKLDEKLSQYLGPVLQQSQNAQIGEAQQQVRALFPQEFAQHEAGIIARLQGMPTETLSNPHAWRIALLQEVGEAEMNRRRGVPQQQNGQPQMANGTPVPAGWQPSGNGGQNIPYAAPNSMQMHSGQFFSEAPSQSGWQVGGTPTPQLNAAQQEMARRFNISNDDYLRGMGVRL